jgi:enoyl-CoA hydratase/carnithine racemase
VSHGDEQPSPWNAALMEPPPLRVERAGGIAWCTLDRPPLNLLEPGVIEKIERAFVGFAEDPSVRVAVLTGTGRAFSAGMDVRILRDLDVSSAKTIIAALHAAIDAVHRAPFPVIAALNGPCLGAGLELVLACDLRLSEVGVRLGLPEVRVGVPSVIEAALLPVLVGPGRAAELLLTGEPITAEQALSWGLLNRVVPSGGLRRAVEELTARILACGPTAIRLQKELMIRWRSADLEGAVAYGINAFATAYATGEPREGATAFLEKRTPRFGPTL